MRALFSAYWEFTKNLEKGMKKYGLNYGNPKVILYLLGNEGCQQVDMARDCYVESATLSSVLSKMEENGLIERKRLEGNKRSYAIYPTEKGRTVLDAVKKQLDLTIGVALSGFSEQETEQLNSYLERIIGNLREA
ncbi:MAG: MarR family transcriptional regulator [Lachnospiraceae bacterium]|nr:MarR family transcriptional regulator [Lachnospiraceae bacterium]